MYRNWKQALIISYVSKNQNSNYLSSIICDVTPSTLKSHLNKKYGVVFGKLSDFLMEYSTFDVQKFKNLKKNSKNIESDLQQQLPNIYRALCKIYNVQKSNPNYQEDFGHFLKNIFYEKIFQRISTLCQKDLNELLEIKLDDTKVDIEVKWRNRKFQYKQMFNLGELISKLKSKEAIELLQGYYQIRIKRNQINHASGNAANEISGLKDMVETYLNELEKYKV